MKKEPVKNSKKYTVTFEMPAEAASGALSVAGDFNGWDAAAHPLQRRKDGTWARTIRLDPGTYRFRYLADGTHWLNDPNADRYEPSGFGEDNSVLEVS